MFKNFFDNWWNNEYYTNYNADDGYIPYFEMPRNISQMIRAIFSGVIIACIANNIGDGILGGLLTLWLIDD